LFELLGCFGTKILGFNSDNIMFRISFRISKEIQAPQRPRI